MEFGSISLARRVRVQVPLAASEEDGMAKKEATGKKRGPKQETLKVEGNWKDAMKRP